MRHLQLFSGGVLLCAAFALLFVMVVPHSSCARGSAKASREGIHELFDAGTKLFDSKKYKKAIEVFNKIEALYPFSQTAIDSSLMSAVAHYELGEYAEAVSLADGYIDIYPNSASIDYAYCIRFLAKFMQISDLELDKKIAVEARDMAVEFVKLFPESSHFETVSSKLSDVNRHLSAKEFLIGKFYLRRGEYIAAIKRFSGLIAEYPDSVYCQESFYRMVEAYVALGDCDVARNYASALEEGSSWREKSSRILNAACATTEAMPQQVSDVSDNSGEK